MTEKLYKIGILDQASWIREKKKKLLELLQYFLGTCEKTYEPAHTSGSEKLGHLFLRVGRVVN